MMTSNAHICPVPVSSRVELGAGIAAVQGCRMGDLTEVGKSLIAFLHY